VISVRSLIPTLVMKALHLRSSMPLLLAGGLLGFSDLAHSQTAPASEQNGSAYRRRGSLMLAQIPQPASPGGIPAQNPNTVRPPNPNIGRPQGIPPRPGAAAGSVARPTQPPSPAPSAPGATQARTPPPAAAPTPPFSDPQQNDAPSDEEMVDIQWVNFPMPQILLEYERLTGMKIVRDINTESASITIETTGELPKDKAIEFIEKSLLLNGYAFIPAGDGILKFLNVAALKPGSEGPDIFTDADKLPVDERIVTFVQPLQFIEAEALQTSLTALVPPHTYQVISPLPNSKGVIITDNTATIRYILKLIEHLDVEPSRTDTKSFQLIRSSAETISEQLSEILDIEAQGSGSGGSSGGARRTNVASNSTPNIPNPQAGQAPGIPAQAAQPSPSPGAGGGAPQGTAIPPKIIPIARTNKLLVIARPIDLAYIESLIEELDGASEQRNFISRPLKYLLASSALGIIEDAITRGLDDEGSSGGSSSSGGNNPLGANNANSSSGGNRTGDFGSNRSGGGIGNQFGSGSSGGSGGFGGGGGGLTALGGENFEPQSIVVGKTLIIADPVANEIFASGPPDQLQALNDVIDQLDKRPRAVIINAIIGELTLNDSKDFGVDYLFRPQAFGNGSNFGTAGGFLKSRVGIAQDIVNPSSLTDIESFGNLVSGLSVFGTLSDKVDFAISALSQNTDFKILSRPTLHTLNNKPASIETGVKVPVPVSTLGSFTGGTSDPTGNVNSGFQSNIQYQDVSLRLDVAPLVLSEDELMLQVKQVNATLAGNTVISGNPIPNISNQGLETTIMVKNNATVLLGGLISETSDKQRSGLPILKDLPLIKYITSSTKDVKDRRELLVFIQPIIVTGEGDAPTSSTHAAGASPLGDDMRRFLTDERNNPDIRSEQVKRSRPASLFRKLFFPSR
jgi:general secretion pathway protein D